VRELSETTSKAEAVWAEARKNNDFSLFLPMLRKIVELKRKEAELIGFKDSPYDALLDVYEPGMTAREIEMIFSELRDFLVPFLSRIMKSKSKVRNILKGKFPIEKQVKFNRMVAEKLGFDFEAGRLDMSTHPFTTQFHPGDVRITTRYSDRDPFYSIGSTIHESGHALYEQGIPMENFGSPLGDSVSLGVHESQSRMWENIIGKSENFWRYFFPRLKRIFPQNFAKTEIKDIYGYVNAVRPSLIRTEADEVTYNLHIIMRFEIEKDLIEGSIAVEDLPKIWNSKVKEYFGIDVPSDTLGVLQDVHWSGGLFGYFPTYALGNLYSAQFYAAAKRDILNLDREMKAGQFAHLLEWLRKNIHVHGKLFSAEELVMRATGERLNAQYFMDYVSEKYSKIYGL